MKHIESPQNSIIKKLFQMREKSRLRKQEGLFIIEGLKELQLALSSGYEITDLYFCPNIISEKKLKSIYKNWFSTFNTISISKEVFQKLAYRSSTEGVVGVAKTKDFSINSLNLKTKNPLILIAEAPEKPGNIGAILRTADAANVDAILIANPKTDLYNPNIIRSSVGCIFTNTIGTGTTTEIIDFLKKHNISIYGAILQASVSYDTQDYTTPTAIVVGTEHNGLSKEWRINTTQNIIIPMGGSIDSMNVSVAAGILIFEAKRQRGF